MVDDDFEAWCLENDLDPENDYDEIAKVLDGVFETQMKALGFRKDEK